MIILIATPLPSGGAYYTLSYEGQEALVSTDSAIILAERMLQLGIDDTQQLIRAARELGTVHIPDPAL